MSEEGLIVPLNHRSMNSSKMVNPTIVGDPLKVDIVDIPNSFAYNFWTKTPTEVVSLTCLMPNGVVIPLETNRNATIAEIKEDLWDEASKYPLHGILKDSHSYIFLCINANAESEAMRDENKRLCDIKPFCCIFKLVEKEDLRVDRNLDSQIGNLIGKGLHEFAALKNSEVNDFRWKMRLLGDEIAHDRQKKTSSEKAAFWIQTRLASVDMPPILYERLQDKKNLVVVVKFEEADTSYTFCINPKTMVKQLLLLAVNKLANTLTWRDERLRNYTLKVCGREEYVLDDHPLSRYSYVQECVAGDIIPTFIAVNMSKVMVCKEHDYEEPDQDAINYGNRPSFSTLTLRKKGKYTYSWNINDNFKFIVNGISRLNSEAGNRTVEVGLLAGLFHGGKSLAESQRAKDIQVRPDGSCEWEETLSFDVKIRDIPRNTRLCFVLYEVSKSSKGIKNRRFVKDSKQECYINPLCWANTTIYDFKCQLKTGAMTLYTWAYAEDIQNEDLLHPLGTVVSNPHIDQAAALMVTFPTYTSHQIILYPSPERMVEFVRKLNESRENSAEFDPTSVSDEDLQQQIAALQSLADRDPLHELHEQERKKIWSMREQCITKVPNILAKLLQCVEWNDHKEVAEATSLVLRWPTLAVERALELLDYAYADQTVRSFAVQCLRDVSDEDLSLYLLQLVQALKHENYLSCELTEFLLRRALNNPHIGHFLFWHLRSEMHVGSVQVRFGLILETFCRASIEHMRMLSKQTECLEKLADVCKEVKQRRDRKAAQQCLQDYLKEAHIREAFVGAISPLNPSVKFSGIRAEKCRVMDSKMRPLFLAFQNVDPFADDAYLILKHGDDLRQDMLTLQMLRIMDRLWKISGLDLRMSCYGCISTDNRVGLIEVVLNAETIANIQKEKGMFPATAAFRRGSLLAWLKDHNHTEKTLNKAIQEFTLSCAGYCVATYVLGIADRHSDNIMVKKSGQLFHVDFGHILGHFKEKFGIRRERVPFVLTNDFVHVINKGQKKDVGNEFSCFQKTCEEAFLVLRKHGSLILSLFAMMISTGLPELSSEKDLNYLRDTLVLEMTEEEARKHFRNKFDEALCNSWKTSLNWASHNMAKSNKTI